MICAFPTCASPRAAVPFCAGLLGQLKTFEEKVARPIDRGDNETARRLRNTIQPFVLRRLKKDVAVDMQEAPWDRKTDEGREGRVQG